MNEIPIRWRIICEYYDAETGDLITKHNATRNYIVQKTESQKEFNHVGTACTIKIQKICIKNPQLKLEL